MFWEFSFQKSFKFEAETIALVGVGDTCTDAAFRYTSELRARKSGWWIWSDRPSRRAVPIFDMVVGNYEFRDYNGTITRTSNLRLRDYNGTTTFWLKVTCSNWDLYGCSLHWTAARLLALGEPWCHRCCWLTLGARNRWRSFGIYTSFFSVVSVVASTTSSGALRKSMCVPLRQRPRQQYHLETTRRRQSCLLPLQGKEKFGSHFDTEIVHSDLETRDS